MSRALDGAIIRAQESAQRLEQAYRHSIRDAAGRAQQKRSLDRALEILRELGEFRSIVAKLGEDAQALIDEMSSVECFPCIGSDNPFEDALGQLQDTVNKLGAA